MQNWKTILTNFISLSGGELLSKGIAFVTTIYLARVISPEGFGIMAFSTAFVSYFLIFVELGLDVIAVKEISRDNSQISKYVNSIVSIKIISAFILYLLLLVTTFFIEKSSIEKMSILIFGLMLFVQAGSLDFLFQSIEKFKYISLKNVGKSILYLFLVLLFIQSNSDIYRIFVFMVFSVAIFIIWQFSIYKKDFWGYKFEIDKQFVKKLLKESYPIMISMLMATIYGNLDIVMLGFMKTNYDVGIYSVSYKLFLLATLPFGILLKVFLPKLSKFNSTLKFRKDLITYAISMIIIGLLILIPLYLLSGNIIELVFGYKYLAADLSLKILLANGMIVCLSIVFGNPLTVWGKQKYHAVILTLGALTNIILNILLIPTYSINGAALATLFSELVVFIGLTLVYVKSIKPIFLKAV